MTYLIELFFTFFGFGLFTIGGGYAMIPLIKQWLEESGYMTAGEIANIIAIGEMSPGPFGINAAAFTGMQLYGLPGAIVAVFGLIAPSLIIVSIVALFFFYMSKNPTVQAALGGIRPVVWALILFAMLLVAQAAFMWADEPLLADFYIDVTSFIIFAVAFACMQRFKKINPAAFVAAAGVVGVFLLN